MLGGRQVVLGEQGSGQRYWDQSACRAPCARAQGWEQTSKLDPWSSAQRAAVLVVPDNEMLTCPSGLAALLRRLGAASEDPSKTRFFRARSCTSSLWLPEFPS